MDYYWFRAHLGPRNNCEKHPFCHHFMVEIWPLSTRLIPNFLVGLISSTCWLHHVDCLITKMHHRNLYFNWTYPSNDGEKRECNSCLTVVDLPFEKWPFLILPSPHICQKAKANKPQEAPQSWKSYVSQDNVFLGVWIVDGVKLHLNCKEGYAAQKCNHPNTNTIMARTSSTMK